MAESPNPVVPPRALAAGLSADDCRLIRASYSAGGITKTELGARYGVELRVIEAVVHGLPRQGTMRPAYPKDRLARSARNGQPFRLARP